MIKLVKRYFGRYRLLIGCVLLFSLLQIMCQLILPEMTDRILRFGVAGGNISYIISIGTEMLAMTAGVGIFMIISGYFSAKITARFTYDIRKDLFDRVKTFTTEEYGRFGAATLLTRSTADLTVMQMLMINSLRSAMLIPFTGLGAIIVAVSMNWPLTVIVLATFTVTLIFIGVCTKKSRTAFYSLQLCVDRINLLLREKLAGARTVRAFGRQQYEEQRITEADRRACDEAINANRSINFLSPVMQLVMNIAMVGIYLLGAEQIRRNMMDTADLIKFFQYILLFVSSLASVADIFVFIPKAKVSADRVMEVLNFSADRAKQPAAERRECETGLVFDKVCFGYEGAQKQVLTDISFSADPGQTIAVVGATGSGKTTLLSLVLGLFDTLEGNIRIDGEDIQTMNTTELRSRISYAPQKSMLLQNTIYENLRLADEGLSRESAMKALCLAEATGFTESLPEGIDTELAQNGMNLSGGQRQRISLARCLCRDAYIYLFDDSFSALDLKTDAKVRTNIAKALQDKIVIIVAQRIATVQNADKILVMDNGRIIASGNHKQLLENSELYRQIYATQNYSEAKESDYE